MTHVDPAAIGQRLRAIREKRGLSLRQVADQAGISHSHLGAIERGETSPTVVVADRIGQVLGLDPSFWFTGSTPSVAYMRPVMLPGEQPSDHREAAILVEALEAAVAHLRARYAIA